MIVMASHMQEQEVGDGTNFVLVFAGALLEAAEELLRIGLSVSEAGVRCGVPSHFPLSVFVCTRAHMQLARLLRIRVALAAAVSAVRVPCTWQQVCLRDMPCRVPAGSLSVRLMNVNPVLLYLRGVRPELEKCR